jgi:carboxymethylenebutenolidase
MPIACETTSYRAEDGAAVSTYLARPAGDGPFPAVLMAYEFWGMLEVPGGGPHMRDVAGRFAAAGYVAAVPDYYAARGQQPTMEGGTIKGGPSDERSGQDLELAVKWLKTLPFVAGERIGVVGWCGGGRQALFLAGRSRELRAAASFYGRPANRPGQVGRSPIDLAPEMHCPIFGAYGEKDHAIAVDTVRSLEQALARSGVPHEFHYYAEAGHAFMNDQRPDYVESAAQDSWRALLAFFARYLKK